jgi:hypothetical protein
MADLPPCGIYRTSQPLVDHAHRHTADLQEASPGRAIASLHSHSPKPGTVERGKSLHAEE